MNDENSLENPRNGSGLDLLLALRLDKPKSSHIHIYIYICKRQDLGRYSPMALRTQHLIASHEFWY